MIPIATLVGLIFSKFSKLKVVQNKSQCRRWFVCEKVKNGVVMTKTKLVVRGSEEYTTNTYKDIPTYSRVAVHMAFFFTTSNQWVCHTAHIKSCIFVG